MQQSSVVCCQDHNYGAPPPPTPPASPLSQTIIPRMDLNGVVHSSRYHETTEDNSADSDSSSEEDGAVASRCHCSLTPERLLVKCENCRSDIKTQANFLFFHTLYYFDILFWRYNWGILHEVLMNGLFCRGLDRRKGAEGQHRKTENVSGLFSTNKVYFSIIDWRLRTTTRMNPMFLCRSFNSWRK